VFLFSGHHERQVDEHGLRGGRAEAVHRTDPRHFGREEDRHVGHHGLLPGRSTGDQSYKTLPFTCRLTQRQNWAVFVSGKAFS
jgi:hypothetical protein